MGIGWGWVSATSWRNQSSLIPQGNAVRIGAPQPSPTPCPLCIPTSGLTSACIPLLQGDEPLALWECLCVLEQWEGKGLLQHKCWGTLNGFAAVTRKTPFPTG